MKRRHCEVALKVYFTQKLQSFSQRSQRTMGLKFDICGLSDFRCGLCVKFLQSY
jgi:hypothetical protein